MTDSGPTLQQLGWGPFFQQQLRLDELESLVPARVIAVHRTGLLVRFEGGEVELALGGRWFQLDAEQRPAVGDWVLLNEGRDSIEVLLERKSLIKRLAPGRGSEVQLIAANIDTLFLVTSCNDEFNLGRLERYLTLAFDAGVQPVVVLSKADTAARPEDYVAQVRSLRADLVVELVNGLDSDSVDCLRAWCRPGQTIAMLGSSGVGKSTLINTLAGSQVQLTGGIREDDAKGRHTTTHRSLHRLPSGALVVDNPGMRELSIADAEDGVAEMFDDIEALAAQCRFGNCAHRTEPGCAVQAAMAAGELDERRLESYRKLQREDVFNTETMAERRSRYRDFSKKVRQAVSTKKRD